MERPIDPHERYDAANADVLLGDTWAEEDEAVAACERCGATLQSGHYKCSSCGAHIPICIGSCGACVSPRCVGGSKKR